LWGFAIDAKRQRGFPRYRRRKHRKCIELWEIVRRGAMVKDSKWIAV